MAKTSDKGRTFGAWLSGEMLSNAERAAGERAGGNESAYVKQLIERDLKGGAPFAPDQELLLSLAKRCHPAIADRIAKHFTAIAGERGSPESQRLIVARFLDALAKAAEDPEFDASKPFNLVDARKLAEWENVAEARLKLIAAEVFELKMASERERAAEGRGTSATKKTRPKKAGRTTSPHTGQIKLQPLDTDLPA